MKRDKEVYATSRGEKVYEDPGKYGIKPKKALRKMKREK